MAALYLIPRSVGPDSPECPPGQIHSASEPCPFKDEFSINDHEQTTCCAFAVDDAAQYLRALNSQECSNRILDEKSPVEAIAFADELAAALAVHTKFLGYAAQYISGSSNPSLDGFVLCDPKSGWQVPVEKAFKRLEQAIEWHRTIGMAGFAVALEQQA